MITELVVGTDIPMNEGYQQGVQARCFWNLSYNGGIKYVHGKDANGQLILQEHRREQEAYRDGNYKDLNFKERVRRATLTNFLKPTIDQYTAFVFKDQITRSQNPKQYTDFLANFNGNFTPVDKVMKATLKEALIVGTTYLLCQAVNTSDEPIITVQQAKINLQFKVTTITPDRVVYHCHEDGLVSQAIIKLEETDHYCLYMYIDNDQMVTFHGKDGKIGTIVSVEAHDFGQCPLIMFTVDTLTSNLAEQQKQIFNYMSLLDEEAFNCTFSQQYFFGVDGSSIKDDKSIKVGSDRMLFFPGNPGISQSAGVLGADPAQSDSLRKSINDAIAHFYRVAGIKSPDPMDTNAPESGVAKQFNMAEIEGRLAGYGSEAERVERLITKMWTITVGISPESEVSYPCEYGMTSIDDQIGRLEKLGIVVPNVIKRLQVMEYQQQALSLNAEQLATLEASLLLMYPDETTASVKIIKPNSDVNPDNSGSTKQVEQASTY